jgi:hypothetical protein
MSDCDIMSLGLIPLALFLLYATIQDVRNLAVERITFAIWGAVALIGWWLGTWPFAWGQAAACFGLLWLAGVGRGDRIGGLLIGGLMPWGSALAVCVALAAAMLYYQRTGRPPEHVAFYPFLSLGVAAMILVRWGLLRGA